MKLCNRRRSARGGGPEARPNVFLGSLDRVLLAMAAHLPVRAVIAPRGRLRNMRLEQRLRDEGTHWREISGGDEYLAAVADLGPKGYCAVAGFSWRIRRDFIDSSEAVINFHPGDLLRCRGPQPLEAALCHGHAEVGVSAHLIDSEELDRGPLIARRLMPVDPERGYSWHKYQVDRLAFELADELFADLARGNVLRAQGWDSSGARWYDKPPAETLKRLYSAPSLAKFYRDTDIADLRG